MMFRGRVTVAAAQYPIDFLESWAAYRAKIERLTAEAAARGARLLVFPEYAALELASLWPPEVYRSLPRQIGALQERLPDFLELHADVARRHGVYVLAGSYPVRQPDDTYRNRAYLFNPSGESQFQEKLLMTRFEAEEWGIQAGDRAKVFETEIGAIGVCICYDSEFPLIGRAQAEAGGRLLLVPSCTDSAHGYHRVRVGSQARALENQCYVVQAVTVGEAPWSPALDANTGAAGVYAPSNPPFPASGVLAQGETDRAEWVYAEIDFALLDEVRARPQVYNFNDWSRHVRFAEREPERVRL